MFEIWDPWEDMRRMNRALRQLDNTLVQETKCRSPRCEIQEKGDEMIASFELPGMDKDDIELNVTESSIEVKAQKTIENETKGKKSEGTEHGSTYSFASRKFYQSFSLPREVDPKKVKAEYKNGILTVKMPKLVEIESKANRILIE